MGETDSKVFFLENEIPFLQADNGENSDPGKIKKTRTASSGHNSRSR